MTTTLYHAKHGCGAIECYQRESNNIAEPYPVLVVGEVTIFPSIEQLTEIRDAIDGYLATKNQLQEA